MDNTTRPKTIDIEYIRSVRNAVVKPVDGLKIPNIHFPSHLISKQRATEASDDITIDIRQLFTSLTLENVEKAKTNIRESIIAKAHTAKDIDDVSEEILMNFIVDERNINNYLKILNSISTACVVISEETATEKKVSPTIGNYFLGKCRKLIFELISVDNIRRLAELEQDDLDELDKYNKERIKIINLITTLCALYEQRNTTYIKLTATHLYSVLDHIFNEHEKIILRMKELGAPEEDCEDEDEYEILKKMSIIYAEQLYVFLSKEAKNFLKDETNVKNSKISTMVDRFKNKVVPTITVSWLISQCELIEY